MIPAAFDYVRPENVDDAVRLLAELGDDARPLAGGHSLVPLMRLRMARPSVLVDIGHLAELQRVEVVGDRLHVGAMVRHVDLERNDTVHEHVPLLAETAGQVGDVQVRNRGTIGGNIAHADPAADYPAVSIVLGAQMVTTKRTIPAGMFFKGLFTTVLEHDELLREIVFPLSPGPHRYLKHGQRLFDWATVAVAVQRGTEGWRVGLTNCGPAPVRALACERALADGMAPQDAAARVADEIDPIADLRASTRYKRHLAVELTSRALEQAEL